MWAWKSRTAHLSLPFFVINANHGDVAYAVTPYDVLFRELFFS
jgi:hypothetical protein